MLAALRLWWSQPCVVRDLRQALCRHCWHDEVPELELGVARCCWCGEVVGERHGPYLLRETHG